MTNQTSFSAAMRIAALMLRGTAIATGVVSSVSAEPTGGSVQSGDIAIETDEVTKTTTLNQTSQTGLIHWQSFNIAPDETVNFVQPSSDSLTVNKVVGANNPSMIFGSMNANGNVMLLNGNGILFGPGAKIDVGGLIASTMELEDPALSDLSNVKLITQEGSDASVVNSGAITVAEGGLVALAAPGVANMGVINAKMGTVNLASGKSMVLDLAGDGLINIEMSDTLAEARIAGADPANTIPAGVLTTKGSMVNAEGGTVLVTAAFAKQVINSAINLSGLTENAPVIDLQGDISAPNGGRIVVHAGSSKNGFEDETILPPSAPPLNGIEYQDEKLANEVKVSGTLSVEGIEMGQDGGAIVISGQHIHLENGSVLNARGLGGSGRISVGSNKNFSPTLSGSAQSIDDVAGNTNYKSPVATSLRVGAEVQQLVNVGDEDTNIANAAYVEYFEGNTPYIMLSGHDGAYAPGKADPDFDPDESVGEKHSGNHGRDTNMSIVMDAASAALGDLSPGAKPYTLNFNIQRAYVDVNRSYLRPEQKNDAIHEDSWVTYEQGEYDLAVDAYKSWHILANKATESVETTHGSGFLIDLHGFSSSGDPHAHDDDKHIDNFDVPVEVMVGYGAIDHADLEMIYENIHNDVDTKHPTLFANESSLLHLYKNENPANNMQEIYDLFLGTKSFSYALQQSVNLLDFDADDDGQDIWVTPLEDNLPKPLNGGFDEPEATVHHFYQGGYNTDAHGSGGSGLKPEPYGYGAVDAVQVEAPSHVRWVDEAPEKFGAAIGGATADYLTTVYNVDVTQDAQKISDNSAAKVQGDAQNYSEELLGELPEYSDVVPPPAPDPVLPPSPDPEPDPDPVLPPSPDPEPDPVPDPVLPPSPDPKPDPEPVAPTPMPVPDDRDAGVSTDDAYRTLAEPDQDRQRGSAGIDARWALMSVSKCLNHSIDAHASSEQKVVDKKADCSAIISTNDSSSR